MKYDHIIRVSSETGKSFRENIVSQKISQFSPNQINAKFSEKPRFSSLYFTQNRRTFFSRNPWSFSPPLAKLNFANCCRSSSLKDNNFFPVIQSFNNNLITIFIKSTVEENASTCLRWQVSLRKGVEERGISCIRPLLVLTCTNKRLVWWRNTSKYNVDMTQKNHINNSNVRNDKMEKNRPCPKYQLGP